MKEKIFVDTDVVLDLLAKREPFYKYAARLFTSADEQKLKIYVSSLEFLINII
jgi:predicted nucleic acid-binding protein